MKTKNNKLTTRDKIFYGIVFFLFIFGLILFIRYEYLLAHPEKQDKTICFVKDSNPDCSVVVDPVSNQTYTECRIITTTNSSETSGVSSGQEYVEPRESNYQVMKEMNRLP